MDPVMIGAVLLAIATGAGEGLGKQLWDGIISLVRRPFHHKAASGEPAAAMVQPTGEAELVALQRAPGDQHKALALAEVLLARSSVDYEFRQALESWWQQAEPIRASISTGNVANTVSGGTQQGPVLQGRDFSNITFGVASATPPPVPPSLEQGARMTDPGREEACNVISGGTQKGPVLQGRDLRVYIGAAAAPVALAQLPANVAGFTDRDIELTTITRLLDPGAGADAVVVSAMAGLAGVGKTALAVAAGHKVRERGWYGGGVLFVDLHGYDERSVQPGQALDALLRALGVAGKHIPPEPSSEPDCTAQCSPESANQCW